MRPALAPSNVLALALVLALVAVVPAPAAASSHLTTTFDVTDPIGDSRAYPDIRLPQTDITRFTSRIEGSDVVQTVTVVGPWPDNDYTVEVRTSFASNDYLTLEFERTDSAGSNSRATDYTSSFRGSSDLAVSGKRVNFTAVREGNTITFRWPASEIPAGATCFQPRVATGSRMPVGTGTTQVDDDLEISPNTCSSQGARSEGVDGTCPAVTRAYVKTGTIQDARDDVQERENLGGIPHDNDTLDIVSLDTRIEDGWVVETLALAQPSPEDEVDLEVQLQYRANESQFERGAYLSLGLFETTARGSIIGEDASGVFHVRAARVDPAGWELRFCAAILPEDGECFSAIAKASLASQRYFDQARVVPDPCPGSDELPEDSDDATGAGAAEAGEGGGAGEGGDADTPALGGLAFLVTIALAALALRRRA